MPRATHSSARVARTRSELSEPRCDPSTRARRARCTSLAPRRHAFAALDGQPLPGFVPRLQAQLGERSVALGRANQIARRQRLQDRACFILATLELGQCLTKLRHHTRIAFLSREL